MAGAKAAVAATIATAIPTVSNPSTYSIIFYIKFPWIMNHDQFTIRLTFHFLIFK